MSRLVQDEGILRIAERVDVNTLCFKIAIDQGRLCMKQPIDIDILHTDFINTLTAQGYRADTTVLTADNTSFTADYHV